MSRHELLSWVNDTLGVNYSKVEQFASGAAACQLCDVIWPGAVQMKKVKFDAKLEHEYIANYKILQQVFTKKGVEKVVEVDRLVKGRFQENLMFAQWLKTFYDQRYSGNEYDAAKRRQEAGAASAPSGAPKRTTAARTPAKTATKTATAARAPGARTSTKPRAAQPAVNNEQMDVLMQELAEVKVTTEGLEKERDFYFEKLRQIEVMCDDLEIETLENLRASIKEILYAVEPGFEAPENEGGEALEDEEF